MRGLVFLSSFFILIWMGCSNPAQKGASYKIVSLEGPSSMGMIWLIDSLRNAVYPEFEVEIVNEPMQARKMMLEGSADFAILPTTMAAILYNKGIDYKLIAIPVWGTLYLVGSDTTINRWEDLRNKKVNVMAKGMTPDVLFRYLLQKNGINPDKDIILDYSFPTHIDLSNAVAAGQAGLAVLPEPMVSLVLSKRKQVRPVFDLNVEWIKQQGIPMAQTAFLGKGSVLREKPQLVEKLISAYQKSTNLVNQHPDSSAVLIVKYNILPDLQVAIQSIPRSNLNFVRASTIQLQINEYLNVFYEMNPEIIGGKIPDENFVY